MSRREPHAGLLPFLVFLSLSLSVAAVIRRYRNSEHLTSYLENIVILSARLSFELAAAAGFISREDLSLLFDFHRDQL